jgi:hypothetical protein
MWIVALVWACTNNVAPRVGMSPPRARRRAITFLAVVAFILIVGAIQKQLEQQQKAELARRNAAEARPSSAMR